MKELRRKWSFKINGQTYVLIKRPQEREEHVLMKILLAKLYADQFADIKIEVHYEVEHRYKPDLLALDARGEALFWGECGAVSQEKLNALIKKYPRTHLCFSKWNVATYPFEKMIDKAIQQLKRPRTAPVDFINFSEAARDSITEQGEVLLDWEGVERKRWL